MMARGIASFGADIAVVSRIGFFQGLSKIGIGVSKTYPTFSGNTSSISNVYDLNSSMSGTRAYKTSMAINAGVGAAGVGGLKGVWQLFTGLLPKVTELITKISPAILKLATTLLKILGIVALFGDKGTTTERILSGFSNIWKAVGWAISKVWNVVLLLVDALEMLISPIFLIIDILKKLHSVANLDNIKDLLNFDFKSIFKRFTDGMKEVWNNWLDTLKELWANFKDTMYSLSGGRVGEKAKDKNVKDPFTFAARSIQTVGFSELGRAQQQIALQVQMAGDTRKTADNTARTAAAVEKMAAKGSYLPAIKTEIPLQSMFYSGGSKNIVANASSSP
jgi:hypothetical protein